LIEDTIVVYHAFLFVVALSDVRLMSKDIPDLLQTRSADYEPPPMHGVCIDEVYSQPHAHIHRVMLPKDGRAEEDRQTDV